MRRTMFMGLVALVAAVPPRAQDRDALVREFQEIERRRSLALKTADIGAVERLYSDDFVGISASGRVIYKGELVANLSQRGILDITFEAQELDARLVDSVALVTGRIVGRDSHGTVVRDGRFLHVYVQRDQEWKLVAAQATPIAP